MFNSTITLYMKTFDKVNREDTYVRKVIEGVHWEDTRGVTLGNTSLETVDGTDVIIPMSIPGYLDFIAWNTQQKEDTWTLKAGDLIFKGNVDIPFENLYKTKHPNKRTIQSVSEVDYALTEYLNNWTVHSK